MKFQFLALAMLASSPAFASGNFLVDFEKNWDYLNGDVAEYYNGGSAADGTSGPDLGVSFVGVSGLSNDADFTYYSGAPSVTGVAYVYDTAFMNVAGGVSGGLQFFYSSPEAVAGAIKAYSGLNGSGDLLGVFDFAANSSAAYDQWSQALFSFAGTAQSFDLSAGANIVALDNVSSVPLPAGFWLLGSGLAMVGAIGRRGKAAA
ncbi:VPLPA-CTERM sorting domain-containing protein [Methylomonas sp. DH-1]|uniref:VPLPA-CTERM sorting domain-containing protein n=1 Tax=Methylomonas sp. (strain DH-1) TaxID=1727196 RepID=UPI0007C8D8CE|nr:VPLPA-CTERM sorting domain-containing protein [Methylomonas sp. DH-1]ANE54656.1 hypothetical protein AYM39_05280 [Methylomonas sp. DH-1]